MSMCARVCIGVYAYMNLLLLFVSESHLPLMNLLKNMRLDRK